MKRIFLVLIAFFPLLTFSQVDLLSLSPSVLSKGQASLLLVKTQDTRFDLYAPSVSFGADINILSTQVITPTLLSIELDVPSFLSDGYRDLQLNYLNQQFIFDDAIQIIDGASSMSLNLHLMPYEFLRISDFDPIKAMENPLIFNIIFSNDQSSRTVKIRFLLNSIDYGELLLAEKNLQTLLPGDLLSITNRDFDDYLINGQADLFLKKSAETSFLPSGEYELIIAVLDDQENILLTDEHSIYLDNNFPDIDLIGPGNSVFENPEILDPGIQFFQWFSSGFSFDFKLVEVMHGQESAEEIMTNYPVFIAEALTDNYLNYTSFAELLEEGKTYAWQISSHYLASKGDQKVYSDVFWFSISETNDGFKQFEKLKIVPEKLIIEPNRSFQFQLVGITKDNEEVKLDAVWEVLPNKYAQINSKGVFRSDKYMTPVQVKASYKNLIAEANVVISNQTPGTEINVSEIVDDLFGLHVKNDLYVSLQSREYTEVERKFQYKTDLFESMELDFSAEGPILWDVLSDNILLNPVSGLATYGFISPDLERINESGKSYNAKLNVDYDITYALPTKSNSISILDSFACFGCGNADSIESLYVHHKIGRISRDVHVHSLLAEIVSIELENNRIVCQSNVYPKGGQIQWFFDGEYKSGEEVYFNQVDSLFKRRIVLSYQIDQVFYQDTVIISINKFNELGKQLQWERVINAPAKKERNFEDEEDIQFVVSEFRELDKINILCPHKGDTVINGEILIVCEVNPRIKIDPSSVQIFIASAEVSSQVRVIGRTISALFTTKVRPDIYDIELRFRDVNKQIYFKNWSFFIANRKMKKEKYSNSSFEKTTNKLGFKGYLSTSARYNKLSGPDSYLRQEPNQYNSLRFNGKISYKKLDIPVRISLSNQENTFLPYRNRFMTGLETKKFKLHIGDFNPYFHKQVLYGQPIRGVNVSFLHRGMEISYAKGEVARSVEGSTHIYMDGQGFPPSNLQPDSSYLLEGNYQRDISVLNLKFNAIDNTTFNIIFLQATDDTNSITYGGYASQNFVFGASNQVKSRNNIFEADFGVALSVTTDDIRKGVFTKYQIDELFGSDLPFFPENFKWLITLNSTTKPLNWNNRPPLALYAKAKLNILKQHFYFKFDRIGSTYFSFGNPYLLNDRLKYSIDDRFSFWKKRVHVVLSYTNYVNNLSEIQSVTKNTQIAGAKLNFNYSKKWPVFSFSMRQYLRNEWMTKTGNAYQSSAIQHATAGANYHFKTGAVKHNLGVSYNHYLNQHSIVNISDQTSSSINVNIMEQLPYNIGFSAFYQSFVQSVDTTDLSLQYTLGFRLSWKTNNNRIRAAISSNTVSVEPALFSSQSFRQVHKFELTYRIIKNMDLTAQLGYGSFEMSGIGSQFYEEFWGMLRLNYVIR